MLLFSGRLEPSESSIKGAFNSKSSLSPIYLTVLDLDSLSRTLAFANFWIRIPIFKFHSSQIDYLHVVSIRTDHIMPSSNASDIRNYTQSTLQLEPSATSRSLRVRSPVRARPGFIIQSPDSRQALRLPSEESDGFVTDDGASEQSEVPPGPISPTTSPVRSSKKRAIKPIKVNIGRGKRKSSASRIVSNSSSSRPAPVKKQKKKANTVIQVCIS